MSTFSSQTPQIVSYNIPKIEVYQVTDDELCRIEEASKSTSNTFSVFLSSISIFFSLLIALVKGEFQYNTENIITYATIGFCVLALIMGISYFHRRSTLPNILKKIRKRKTEPVVS